jgi:hypothetical protein
VQRQIQHRGNGISSFGRESHGRFTLCGYLCLCHVSVPTAHLPPGTEMPERKSH